MALTCPASVGAAAWNASCLAAGERDARRILDVFFVTLAPEARLPAMRLVAALRGEGVACDLDYGGRGAKGQFRQADRSGAAYAAILGEDELQRGVCKLRDMRSGEERAIPVADGAKELILAVTG